MSVVSGKRKENDLQVIRCLRELAIHTITCCCNESVFPKSNRGKDIMTMLSVEKRLARLEAIVLRNGTALNDNAQRVDYIAACDHPEVFEEWRPDEGYNVWDKRRHNGIVYTCLQAHTSQIGWEPNVAVSLWAKVLNPDPSVIPGWEQPGSTNPYMRGDKVTHKGKTWESTIDGNVWEPGAPGVYTWVEVTD